MKYAKFQHRSPDKITKYTALYLEKLSFCWRQQFARVTQKPELTWASHTRHAKINCKAISIANGHASILKSREGLCGLPLVRKEVWNSVSSHLKTFFGLISLISKQNSCRKVANHAHNSLTSIWRSTNITVTIIVKRIFHETHCVLP